MFDSIGGSSARLGKQDDADHEDEDQPGREIAVDEDLRVDERVLAPSARWTMNTQKPVIARPSSIQISARGEPVELLAAVEHQLQRADAERQHGEAEEIEAAQPLGDARQIGSSMPRKARMPTGRLMKNTQRQLKVSVSQPPSVGPTIGPTMMPAPQIAMA